MQRRRKLAKACGDIDNDFLNYLDECSAVTEYYFESRYPLGDIIEYPLEEIEESLDVAYKIIDLINDKTKADIKTVAANSKTIEKKYRDLILSNR